ncbi:MAG TPA: hypothetical protein PKM69_04840 [Bacteroidales bacterium]|nr:hypothetical protein [Bacteroidales bacterium]
MLEKLNYKGQKRIAIINVERDFSTSISKELKGIIVDNEIDPRFPYDFMIIFVKSVTEVDSLAPGAIHNLVADGILWFCYPKKTSTQFCPDLDCKHGWNALKNSGFRSVRHAIIDENWSAIRFRNIKYIKSAPEKF